VDVQTEETEIPAGPTEQAAAPERKAIAEPLVVSRAIAIEFQIVEPREPRGDDRVRPEEGLEVEEPSEMSAEATLLTEAPKAVRPPAGPRSASARHFGRRRAPAEGSYTDEELRRALDKLINSKKYPEMAIVPPLRRFVTKEMVEAASDHRYEYGFKLELADQILEGMADAEDAATRREQRRSAAADKLTIMRQRRDDLAREWTDKLLRLREEHNQRLADLEATHRADIEQFERRWTAGGFLLEFNKPSASLIAIRSSQHHLAVMKQFDRAGELKKEGDKIERGEVDLSRARAIVAMKIEFENLTAKQKREMQCLLENSKRHTEVNEGERDRALKPFDLLIERLAPIANPKKLPERKKEGVFTPHVNPMPTRPLRNVRTNRGISPYALDLPAIPIRAHIQVKRQNSQTAPRRKGQTANTGS
jgi:hypothetical protein